MGKYVNMSKAPPISSSAPLPEEYPKKLSNVVVIAVISLISGLAVLGISWTFLGEINQNGSDAGKQDTSDFAGGSGNNQLFVVVITVGVVAVLLQLITSVGFWYLREKEYKPLIFGYAIGQAIIQTVLLVCLGLIVYQFLKPKNLNGNVGSGATSSSNNPTGHGFWIILSANVIFHFVAICYLLRLVMKRTDEEQMEEMTAVVIHRRVPSRIPSERTKRHGRMQK